MKFNRLYYILQLFFFIVSSFCVNGYSKPQNKLNKIEKLGLNLLEKSPIVKLPYGSDLLFYQFEDTWNFARKQNEKSKGEKSLDSLQYSLYAQQASDVQLLSIDPSISRLLRDSGLLFREHIYMDVSNYIRSYQIDFKTSFTVYSVLLQSNYNYSGSEYSEHQIVELLILMNKNIVLDKLIISKIEGSDLSRSMCFSYIDTFSIIHIKHFTHDEEKEYFDFYQKYQISTNGKFIRYYNQDGIFTNKWEYGLVRNHTREGRWSDITNMYIIESEYTEGLPVGEWKYYNLKQDYDEDGNAILSSRRKGDLYAIEKYIYGELVERKKY